jgi:hypothetical protein
MLLAYVYFERLFGKIEDILCLENEDLISHQLTHHGSSKYVVYIDRSRLFSGARLWQFQDLLFSNLRILYLDHGFDKV